MKSWCFLLLSTQLVVAQAAELGWDAGMKKALAASLLPGHAQYQEACPDSPTGRCFGTIQKGGGFYTLPIEVNTADSMAYSKNYFQWVRQEGELIARLEVDSRDYPNPMTPNFYVGLQRNIPIGNTYAGLDFNDPVAAPKSSLIDNASLEFRAVICPRAPAEDYFLTLHYYSDGWSIPDQQGYSLAFNYGFSWSLSDYPVIFKDALMSQGAFMRTIGYSENESALYDTTIAIDAHRYGMLPMPSNNSAVTVSCTADINTLPFKKVTFDIGKFLGLLKLKGIINNNDHYRYAGGIIAGIEAWGRVKVTLDVRRHIMRSDRSKENQNANISEGLFRLPDNSLWYSNGEGVCQYINLEHARIAAAQDIARIVPFIPAQMQTGWCPGYDTLDLVKKHENAS
jgi:hypothetical protein